MAQPVLNYCSECIYWDPKHGSPENPGIKGECRRHAPSPTGKHQMRAEWPLVSKDDWCGDGYKGRPFEVPDDSPTDREPHSA